MKRLLSAGMLALLPFAAFASAPEPSAVPEPGTLGLVALGIAAGLYMAKRGRRK